MTDLCAAEPCGRYHGLWVELKQPNNQPSDDQMEFITALRDRGYAAYWCDSMEDALLLFNCYLNKGEIP